MAGSVNKVILVGNLGQDPEVQSFQNGGKVANLRIATSECWRDKNTGGRHEKTQWHRAAVHGDGLVGVVERFLKKGHEGLHRRPARDAQMAGPGWPRPLFHRGRAPAALGNVANAGRAIQHQRRAGG